MIKLITLFTLILGATCATPSWAQMIPVKEGFSQTKPAQKFLNAWQNVLPILVVNVDDSNSFDSYGSGSVVYKTTQGDYSYLGILTAGHVIQKNPGQVIQPSKDMEFTGDDQSLQSFTGAEIISQNIARDSDLGFVILKVSKKEAAHYSTIPFSSTCEVHPNDPLVSIGFPGTDDREAKQQNTPITDFKTIRKRWATGFYVGDKNQVENDIGITYGTTVDSLHGDSGCPALNSSAEIIGVISGGLGDETTGYRYEGNETPGHIRSQSFLIDCQTSKNFAQTFWQQFLQKMPREI